MYLEKYSNNGIEYLRIRKATYNPETKKQKKEIVKNLGPLSKYDNGQPNLYERLKSDFRNGIRGFEGIFKNTPVSQKLSFTFNGDHEVEMKNMGYFILENLYRSLGIEDVLHKTKSQSKIQYDLNGLAKLFVFGRILNPNSKFSTFGKRDDFIFPVCARNSEIQHVYRCLDVLAEKSQAIQKRMNTKIKNSSIGRKVELTYYDVTNYFFETSYGDEDVYVLDEQGNPITGKDGKPLVGTKGLRKPGVCKYRSKKPLVAMGLFMDQNGIPVAFDTFSGNTQDKSTLKEMIVKSINKKELGKIVVVADNGNHAQENLFLLAQKGNGYVMSQSVKQKWNAKPKKKGDTALREWALDEGGYDCRYKVINDASTLNFKSKSRIYERVLERTLEDGTKEKMTVKEKTVIFWSRGHYLKQLRENKKFIVYLESCVENPSKLKDRQRKSQEFIKVLQTDKKTGEIIKTKPLTVLLTDKIEKQKEIMGFYSIVTSEIDKSDSEIIASYHRLSRIEDSFRVLKTDFDARPIFLSNNERIHAHFLICFIALTILRIIQHKVLVLQGKDTFNLEGWESGITAGRLQEALDGHKVATDEKGVCLFTKKTEDLMLVYQATGIDVSQRGLTVDSVSKFRNMINKAKIM